MPGLPGKTARDIWTHLHRTGRLDSHQVHAMSDERERLKDMTAKEATHRLPRLRRHRRDRSPEAVEGAPAPVLYADSRLEDLVVITGYSGAGKSTAMNVFEDAGYFCVDNLPPEMIRALVELFVHEGSKVERAAIVSDVRGGDYFEALRAVLEDLARLGLSHRVLFLEASDEALMTRYQETRRRHPLAPASSVERGIAAEHEVMEPLRELADVVIDSTDLKAHMLRRKIADEMLPRAPTSKLSVIFESFGFKHGPARDADIIFDVRFLPNPHYEPGAAAAHRPRPAGRRLRRARRAPRRAAHAHRAAAGLPAAAVHQRGQGAPGDRHRLHGRAPPLGRDRRAPVAPLDASATTCSWRSSTATSRAPIGRAPRARV